MILSLIIFIILVVLIVLVTRNIMIYNIRKLAILLSWKSSIVGQVLGYATSTPELLSAFVAGSLGMVSTSIYNVLSSNFVNLFLVVILTIIYKRQKSIINKKFIYDYIIILITLIVPLVLVITNLATTVYAVPALLIIYGVYLYGAKYVEYFASEETELELEEKSHKLGMKISKKRKIKVDEKRKVAQCVVMLMLSIVALYFLGEALGNELEKLGKELGVSEMLLGMIMGIITSIPELLTFLTSYRRHRRYHHPEEDRGAVEVINNLATSNISNLAIIQTVAIISFIIFAR